MLILNHNEIKDSIQKSFEQKTLSCQYQDHCYFKFKSYQPHQLEMAKKECRHLLEGQIQLRAIIIREPEFVSVWLSSLEEIKRHLKSQAENFPPQIEKPLLAQTKEESNQPTLKTIQLKPFAFLTSLGVISSVLIATTAAQLYQTSSTANLPLSQSISILNSPSLKELEWKDIHIPSGLFNYGGSSAWNPIREKVDSLIQSQFPEFQLRFLEHPIKPSGSNIGIDMLLNNELTFAQSSRPLKPSEYQLAKQQGYSLKQIPIAIDGIAFAVHPDLDVPGLTVVQLRDIYLGKITNWKQVGGPDLEISPYSRSPKVDGAVNYFLRNILQGQQTIPPNVKIVKTTDDGIKTVANNLGAIYYVSTSEIISTCNVKALPIGRTEDNYISPYLNWEATSQQCQANPYQINREAFRKATYPLTRILFAIVKKNGELEEQAGMAYATLLLSEEGQKALAEAGFVRIR